MGIPRKVTVLKAYAFEGQTCPHQDSNGQHKFVWLGVGQVCLLEILFLVLGPYGKHVGEYLWSTLRGSEFRSA
jgi:hypothetical protein